VRDLKKDQVVKKMTQESSSKKAKKSSFWKGMIPTLLVVLLFRSFIADAYVIPSGSMKPSLEVGDRLFVNKLVYGLRFPWTTHRLFGGRAPERGEIVVFLNPKDPMGTPLIKRVIALGGDRISMRDNQLFVNGQAIARQREEEPCSVGREEEGGASVSLACTAFWENLETRRYEVIQQPSHRPMSFETITVPRDQLFVMGDNRDDSNDSRYWGFLPATHLVGKALFIFWSSGEEGIRWRRMMHSLW
jgi:signal peptidase I